jgi:Do/DeqQ family serine protease
MKKFFLTLLVAFVGGSLTILADKWINPKEKSMGNNTVTFQNAPVQAVSYSGPATVPGDFTEAAEVSLNAVVHIKTTITTHATKNNDPFYNWFFGNPNMPHGQMGSGSGVIINKDGYVVTNNHVIRDADKIEVTLNDKRSYAAEIIGTDPQTDIALLKIRETELPFLIYGNSDQVRIGEWALAVGNPFNLTSTVTAGIISAKGRNINIIQNDPSKGLFPIESFIQTDAAVNPGNSGGALVNTRGELIGINTAIASQTGSYAGYSFAVPVNIVKKVVADLLEFGSVQRAFIGVSIRDIDAEFAEEMGIKNLNGVYVNGLNTGGAGEAAGIKVGDVITKVENNPVKNIAELQEQISKYRPGDKVTVSVIRDGKDTPLTMVLKNKNNETVMNKAEVTNKELISSLGANFETITKEEMSKLKITNGIKVSNLHAGKFAAAGIREGFIILTIDKKKINTLEELESTLKAKTGGVLIEGIYPNGVKAYYGFGL